MANIDLVIKMPEEVYKNIRNGADIEINYGEYIVVKDKWASERIRNGTPLPKDATNGDVFMTMFPNLIWHSVRGDLIGKTSVDMPIGDRWQKNVFYCDTDWWEAPYKESQE